MTWRRSALVVALTAGALVPAGAQPGSGDPFAFLAPAVTLTRHERNRLAADEVIAKITPGRDGQAGVFVVTRLNAPPDRLGAWTHSIAEFKRSRFVQAIGRFSEPPVLADLDGLVLEDEDIDDARHCRPGDCGLKLSADEMAALSRAWAAGGDDPRAAVQVAFRRVVLARLEAYRRGGLGGVPPIIDDEPPRRLDESFAAVLEQSPYLAQLPSVRAWLTGDASARNVESFYYWSKEHYGSGKPVVSVTHVGILRPTPAPGLPAVVVAGKQLLATHYVRASLGLTMVLPGDDGGAPYLAYVNRTSLDILRGFIGGLARRTLERRMARQAPTIIGGLRTRLESGAPPVAGGMDPAARAWSGPLFEARGQLVEQRGLSRQDARTRRLE